MRSRAWAVMALSALVGAVALVPGVVRAADAPTGTCPTNAADAAGGTALAGYGMRSLAAGIRYQLRSPGLLPVGDPNEGAVAELDVPFSRVNVSGGPLINAVASPAYPGEAVAHLGTALATFGMAGVPNYPIVAESTFPPSPTTPAEAAFLPTGVPGVAALSGNAASSEKGGAASSHIATVGVPGVFSIGSSLTESDVEVQAGCVHSVARTVVTGIDIAGMVRIDGVQSYSAAVSDGVEADPIATFSIGRVTVSGMEAYIDRTGIHLAGGSPLGEGVADQVEAALRQVLDAARISIFVIPTATSSSPAEGFEPASAAADAGGLFISFPQELPEVPGVIAPTLTFTEVLIGGSRVAVDATVPPDLLPLEPLPPLGGLVDGGALSGSGEPLTPLTGAGGAAALGTPVGGRTGTGTPAGTGTNAFGPTSSGAPLTSEGIPVGWIIIGFLACIVAMGPLLGYARWQLLEGRI